MRRRVLAALAAVGVLALGLVTVASAAPGDLHLDCPLVSNPVAGQTITCTYVAEAAPPTTTVPPTTTAPVTTTVPTTTTPPVGRSCPALPASPTPSCTGAPSPATLTSVSGDVTAPAGTVIDGKRITGKVVVVGNGVTIKNSEIHGGITNDFGHYSFTVTDTTLGPPSGCNPDEALKNDKYTALRVRVRNFGDAFRITSNPTNVQGPATNSLASDVTIQDSYALLCANPGDHSDGIQGWHGGTNVQILHNTIDQRGLPAGTATAPLFNADWSKGIVARDNLLAGGSFTVRVYSDGTGLPNAKNEVTGNRVVNDAWQYGPSAGSCRAADVTWSNNTLVTLPSTSAPQDPKAADYVVTSTVGALACA